MTASNLLLLLIAGPIVFGLFAWLSPRFLRAPVVIAGCALTAVSGLLAIGQRNFTITLAAWGPDLAWCLELGLILAICAIGIARRHLPILLLGLVQLALALLADHGAPEVAAKGIDFFLDPLALILVLIITLVGSPIVVYALGYMAEHEHHAPPTAAPTGRFFLILLGFLGLMNGLVLADDLRWLSIFWEATTLCSFFLISHDGTVEARQNGARALLINSVGGAAMLLAGLLAGHQGMGAGLSGIMAAKGAAVAPFALLCLAAFAKSAQMPCQSWLLGAMVAPTPVSALLHSATMVKAGSYLILRLAPAFAGEKVMAVVAVAGAFTFALTSALAVGQSNAKKVLAYSTIANLGLIVACAGINTPLAYAAALMILCFHAVSKGLLFLCVGTIEQKIGSRDIEDMGGILFALPFTTGVTLIGMMSMLLPPFGMLLSKWIAIEAAIRTPLTLILLILGSALTVLFWVKWIGRVQTVSYHKTYVREKLASSMSAMLLLLAVAVLVAGIAAAPLFGQMFRPLAEEAYRAAASMPVQEWTLLGQAASIPFWPVFLFLGLALAASWAATRTFRPEQVRLPYLCGENLERDPLDESETPRYVFRSVRDEVDKAWAATFYLPSLFEETRLTGWSNLVATLILLAMFGVVHLI